MLIKGIDFPEELLRAQRAGELVVFAGAGVSNPPPSSLPLFPELACRVGANSGIQPNPNEPEDRYLGRLKKRGVRVHELAASILVHDDTKPHHLHQLLLQMFTSPKAVRVVTTNFDTHFSSAAKAVHGSGIEVFHAPALPLGNQFSGLIYLHGCAGKDPAKCVLTDEDFGRAYLTEAWASRFLAAMFSRYTVLFVGYSHRDTVMNYLARGLPPVGQKPRFAFAAETSDLSEWEFLGIRPLLYKTRDGDNPHQAITESVEELVAEVGRGLLEKSQRIRSIAGSQPPLEGEDADYMHAALADIDTARVFLRHACLPTWISWLDKRGLFENLFDPTLTLSQLEREVGYWLVDRFLIEHSKDLLALFERKRSRLHPDLGRAICFQLGRSNRDDAGAAVRSCWVAVLVSQPHAFLSDDDWASLLLTCRLPEDRDAALLLFDLLTRPRVALKRWTFQADDTDRKVDLELNLSRDRTYSLSEAWTRVIRPNLAAIALPLESIATANLQLAHALLQASGRHASEYDPITLHRHSIEPHEQDRFPQVVDVLIDAARDALSCVREMDSRWASCIIEGWFGSDLPILKRIAIHGFAKQTDTSADDKLRWAIDHGLLFRWPLKTEVLFLLRSSYPSASEAARQQLLDYVMRGPQDQLAEGLEDEAKRYEVFNLLVWLQRADMGCPLVAEKIAAIKRANPNFQPQEYPELNSWLSNVEDHASGEGFDVEAILSRTPEEFLDALLAAPARGPLGKRREDYTETVAVLVTRKPEWGIGFQNAVLSQRLEDGDIWSRMCQGWRSAKLEPKDWRDLLTQLETADASASVFERIVDILEDGVRRANDALPIDLMDQAQRVAEKAWDRALVASPADQTPNRDWLFTAINRPGGKLAQFWLQRLSAARKVTGDSWVRIPADIGKNLLNILHGTSGAAAHGRVVLASQIHYLFWLDAEFTKTELFPLFDWQTDATRAEQCWHGFLFWGRWLPGYVKQLLPHFDETVRRVVQLQGDVRRALIQHIAGVALFALEDPLADGWLVRNVQILDGNDLQEFAATIDQSINETDPTIAEGIWSRWMERYWQMRCHGIPQPLLQGEAKNMAGWALGVGKHFPEAVRLATQMGDLVSFEDPHFQYRIDKRGVARSYPDATADLFLFYLRRYKGHLVVDELRSIFRNLQQGGVSEEQLAQIQNELFRLGWAAGPSC